MGGGVGSAVGSKVGGKVGGAGVGGVGGRVGGVGVGGAGSMRTSWHDLKCSGTPLFVIHHHCMATCSPVIFMGKMNR